MKEVIYVYQPSKINNYLTFINVCTKMNIEVVEIDNKYIHLKLKDILSNKKKAKKNKPLEQPMVIFQMMQPNRIDMFLDALKKANVPLIPLKAMVTATNINWTMIDLYHQLIKEHQMMTKI